jgi:hypothetical protein
MYCTKKSFYSTFKLFILVSPKISEFHFIVLIFSADVEPLYYKPKEGPQPAKLLILKVSRKCNFIKTISFSCFSFFNIDKFQCSNSRGKPLQINHIKLEIFFLRFEQKKANARAE